MEKRLWENTSFTLGSKCRFQGQEQVLTHSTGSQSVHRCCPSLGQHSCQGLSQALLQHGVSSRTYRPLSLHKSFLLGPIEWSLSGWDFCQDLYNALPVHSFIPARAYPVVSLSMGFLPGPVGWSAAQAWDSCSDPHSVSPQHRILISCQDVVVTLGLKEREFLVPLLLHSTLPEQLSPTNPHPSYKVSSPSPSTDFLGRGCCHLTQVTGPGRVRIESGRVEPGA